MVWDVQVPMTEMPSWRGGTTGHVRRYVRQRHEPEPEDYFYHKHVWLRWWWDNLIFKVVSFILITFTPQTVFSVGLSIGATVLFNHFSLTTDMPLSLLAAALFFPLSFGIGFNMTRREGMLKDIGMLRALLLGLWMGARDWMNLEGQQERLLSKLKTRLSVLLVCIRQTMLHNTPPGGSQSVYMAFDDLALVMVELSRTDKVFNRSGMDSRWQQYFKQALETFERIRVNHDYRTPSSLRAFALIYLFLMPLFLAPLFANYARLFGLAAGCYCAALTSLLFCALHKIFSNEEDPLDGQGIDDLSLESLTTLTDVMYSKRKGIRQAVVVERHTGAKDRLRQQRLRRPVKSQSDVPPPSSVTSTRVSPRHATEQRSSSAPHRTSQADITEERLQRLRAAPPLAHSFRVDSAAFLDLRASEYMGADISNPDFDFDAKL